jgi:hypothetical protein
MAKRKWSRRANLAVSQPCRDGTGEAFRQRKAAKGKELQNARDGRHVVRQQCHEQWNDSPAQWGSVARSAPIDVLGSWAPWRKRRFRPKSGRSRPPPAASRLQSPSVPALQPAQCSATNPDAGGRASHHVVSPPFQQIRRSYQCSRHAIRTKRAAYIDVRCPTD